MTDAKTTENMSPQLLKVAERANRDPNGRILALAHLIDIAVLRCAYQRQRKDAAVGVDGVTKEQYGQGLGERLASLHQRLVDKQYRHQPNQAGASPQRQRQDTAHRDLHIRGQVGPGCGA